jgi:thioredoxin 1
VATVQLTQANFEQTINDNDIIVVDFWAPWCGPCRSFAPTFEKVSNQYPNMVFAKVNTEEERDLAGYFQIRSIPTLMIFKEQIIIFSQAGALPESGLVEVIGKAQELDMNMVREEIAAKEKQNSA